MKKVLLLLGLLVFLKPVQAQNVSRANAGINAKSANYSLGCADALKLTTFSAAATATLPSASTCGVGAVFQIKNVTATVTITIATSSGTINGQANIPLGPDQGVDIYDDGTNYTTQPGKDNSIRTCDIAVGDASGSAITNAQLGPQIGVCLVPFAATVIEIQVLSDAGTPNIIVGRDRLGTQVNLLSSALATGGAGVTNVKCSNTGGTTSAINGTTTCSATLQNTGLNAGDYIYLVSGTAGGTAKLMTVHIVYTVN